MATVEWEASPAGDIVADSVVALILHSQGSAASIRLTSQPCNHRPDDRPEGASDDAAQVSKRVKREFDETDLASSRLRMVNSVLREQFTNVEAIYEGLSASFEIKIVTGYVQSNPDEEADLTCTVRVEFSDQSAADAKVTVESQDDKLAANVRLTIQNTVAASVAVNSLNNGYRNFH